MCARACGAGLPIGDVTALDNEAFYHICHIWRPIYTNLNQLIGVFGVGLFCEQALLGPPQHSESRLALSRSD
ncbi:hypothetical protein FQA47_002399 [Oryzias melastigma]|uniref:Uncharacterized protein n=1 Tax=Oryzias melastigma TaxID=30732 RepID=A0A834KWT3_ORYME|nr:hypothetical protein FQA47_002399 [Oryzias melastigma]